jgi:hypothetical protein
MIRRWLVRLGERLMTTQSVVHGIPVSVVNMRPDVETTAVLARLDAALTLIAKYTPHYYRHLQRDFRRVVVQRYACRGAYLYWDGSCLIELTFTTNPHFTTTEVAATILHEAMHARLHRLGFPLEMEDRARQERFCRRAEIVFGQLVPDGDAVVERAMDIIAAPDDLVALEVDPDTARKRIREADLAVLPPWIQHLLTRHERQGPR